LKSNPSVQRIRVSRRSRIAAALTISLLLATPAFAQESPTASDVGNWLVVLFGMLLWVACFLSLVALGIRAMTPDRNTRSKNKRYRHGENRS
jgi:hypothetical protein